MTQARQKSSISKVQLVQKRKSESEWTKSGLVKQLGQLVPAMGEELVLLVERGKIRLEHDGEFFS